MSVYEIVPETDLKGGDLGGTSSKTSISKCRKMCDKDRECLAFVWSEKDKSGICTLKKNLEGSRGWDSSKILYIKRGNHSYWLLWIFLVILGIIIFMYMAQRKI